MFLNWAHHEGVPKTSTILTKSGVAPVTPVKERHAREVEEVIIAPVVEEEIIPPQVTELLEVPAEETIVKPTEIAKEKVVTEEPAEKSVEPAVQRERKEDHQEIVETPRRRRGLQVEPTIAKTIIKLRGNRTVNINRCEDDDVEIFDLWSYLNCAPLILLQPIDDEDDLILPLLSFIAPLMNENDPFLSTIRESPRLRASMLRSYALSKMESVPGSSELPTRRTFHTPLEVAKPNEVVVVAEIHSPPSKRRKTTHLKEQIIEEPPAPKDASKISDMAITVVEQATERISEALLIEPELPQPAINGEQISIAHPNVTIETEIPPAGQVKNRKKDYFSDNNADENIQIKRKRLKSIKLIIKNWNFEASELTIEDVCTKPINRLNIAVAFNDLLTLHKMEYIKLNNKPNSIEFGSIEKGDKYK